MTNENDSGVISGYTSEYLLNGQKSEETVTVMDEEEENSTKTASYTYDSNNNRREMTSGNWATSYKYNKNDELLCTDTLNTNTIVMSFLFGCTTVFFERRCRKAVYKICSIFSFFFCPDFPIISNGIDSDTPINRGGTPKHMSYPLLLCSVILSADGKGGVCY